MKKISTLLASLILTISVFAAAKPTSIMTIKSAERAALKVVVDGRRFEPNDNSIRIEGLDVGVHQVKIYQQKNTGLFSILGKKYELVFNSTVKVKQRANTMISIDRLGQTSVSIVRTVSGNSDNDYAYDNGVRGGDYGQNGQWDNHYGYTAGMDSREFQDVLQSINKEWLESNKLKSATQIVSANSLTAAQVKEMMGLFSFDSNKLELAKSAYRSTVDKENYSCVSDALSFNSSKQELARFLRTSR
ncbi:MAG: DUF4476 domain-containing protein [Chitinophagaceae bacterium]